MPRKKPIVTIDNVGTSAFTVSIRRFAQFSVVGKSAVSAIRTTTKKEKSGAWKTVIFWKEAAPKKQFIKKNLVILFFKTGLPLILTG